MNQGYSGPDEPTIAQERLMPPMPMQSEGWPPVTATLPAASPFATRKTINPEQLIRRSAATALPRNPVQRVAHLWHSDPAYKVFIIAIATGIVSALIAIILVSSFFSNIFASPSSTRQSYAPTTATTAPVATATAISTPAGDTQNSLPPLSTTPIIPPTMVPVPTPTPVANGPLTLEITNVPATAQNGSSVPVSVTSNKSNIKVKLTVTYTAPANNFTSGSHMTNGDGNVTINWHIFVLAFNPGNGSVIARVTAVARDQNGQMVSSQTVSVQIMNKG